MDLTRFAWLSIIVGVTVFTLKLVAWQLTDSVGLLSDAMESTVNIIAAVVALLALRAARRPPDMMHNFGRGKAEYFSALVEGMMILLAAALIVQSAIRRLIEPEAITDVAVGITISVIASVFNGALAVLLLRAGRTHRSLVLVADGKHLLTDVWTSVGVIVGVAAVAITGWLRLDPIIALIVAANIVITGVALVRESTSGLMDAALPEDDQVVLLDVLRSYQSDEVQFHALQTRQSGRHRFVSVHVLVPGAWSVQQGHDLLEDFERSIREALPDTTVNTHLEPIEDPKSWEDVPTGHIEVPHDPEPRQ